MQFNAVAAAAGGGAAAAGAAQIAGWPADVIATVSSGGAQASQAAAVAAVTAMGQAGAELAGYVKSLLLAKGAQFVIVRNLPDVNVTPYGLGLDAATQGLLTAAITAFNGQLQAGLNGSNGVLLYDDYAQSRAVAASPANYGFTNVTTRSCGANAFGSPNGPSILCNASNLIAGDTSRFAFADDVHPTPYAHSTTADGAFQLMVSAEWQ
jgi:phospholipase/lecithinase/hemolysin